MNALRRFFRRLTSCATSAKNETRLRAEIEEHIAMQTADNLRAGLSPVEARRQAVLKFGSAGRRGRGTGAALGRLHRRGVRAALHPGGAGPRGGRGLPGPGRLRGRREHARHVLRHVPELARLRLSSIDQVEADADLMRALAEEARLMPHLHLSLQSGDDLILKRMKRRHTRADTIRFCSEVRRLRPDVVLGADLIAGFPTETEEMFANSLKLTDDCGLTFLHVFPFSPRPGTPAARMPQVDRREVKARAARLRKRGEESLAAYLSGQVGRDVELLMESDNLGRTPGFAEMTVGDGAQRGELRCARVIRSDGRRLHGEVLAPRYGS